LPPSPGSAVLVSAGPDPTGPGPLEQGHSHSRNAGGLPPPADRERHHLTAAPIHFPGSACLITPLLHPRSEAEGGGRGRTRHDGGQSPVPGLSETFLQHGSAHEPNRGGSWHDLRCMGHLIVPIETSSGFQRHSPARSSYCLNPRSSEATEHLSSGLIRRQERKVAGTGGLNLVLSLPQLTCMNLVEFFGSSP
jgi:hypothetical protein